MISWIKALFTSSKDDSEGVVYLGDGFGKGEGCGKSFVPDADENGKIYFRFRLITEGECRGKYEPVPSFFSTRGDYRDVTAENEMRDIINSGYEIHAPDPKGSI